LGEPGWTTIVKYDQNYFSRLYAEGRTWGNIPTDSTTYGTIIYFGGRVSSPVPTDFYSSPDIQLKTGYKNKSIIMNIYELVPASGQSASATLAVLFTFMKDGTTLHDDTGNNAFGVSLTISDKTTTYKILRYTSFVVEGRTVKIYVDGTELTTIDLNDTPTSFKVLLRIASVSAGTASVGVYDVEVMYYDPLSHMISQIIGLVTSFMPVMILVPLVAVVFKGFRKRRKAEKTEVTAKKAEEGGKG